MKNDGEPMRYWENPNWDVKINRFFIKSIELSDCTVYLYQHGDGSFQIEEPKSGHLFKFKTFNEAIEATKRSYIGWVSQQQIGASIGDEVIV